LHVAVIIVEQQDANAAAAVPAYLLFDFIPADATEISTVTSLFRGQAVPGIIREKVSVCMLWGELVRANPRVRKGRDEEVTERASTRAAEVR
jgi:hypothetical protein